MQTAIILAISPRCPAAKATCKSYLRVGHSVCVCHSFKTSDIHEIYVPKLAMIYSRNPRHVTKKLLCNINISNIIFAWAWCASFSMHIILKKNNCLEKIECICTSNMPDPRHTRQILSCSAQFKRD